MADIHVGKLVSLAVILWPLLTGFSKAPIWTEAPMPIFVATDSLGREVAPGVTDDASLLLSRCGHPSSDDSTAYDRPRPLIVSRFIEYAKKGLRFAFVPSNGQGW
jgi:hypothetical protein